MLAASIGQRATSKRLPMVLQALTSYHCGIFASKVYLDAHKMICCTFSYQPKPELTIH